MDQIHAVLSQALTLLKDPIGSLASDGVKAIDVGIANKSYVAATENGEKYVVRLLRAQTDESARAEAVIQRALAGAGLNSPQYLPFKDGDIVAHVDGERVAVSAFIVGETPKEQSLKLTRSLGATLAKLHDALSSLPHDAIPESSAQAFNIRNIANDIAKIPTGEFAQVLKERFEKFKTFPEKDLPRAIIHGDLFASNVFAEDDEVTAVFDFETTQYTLRILDLARPHLENLEMKMVDPKASATALIEGYNSSAGVPLTSEEIAAFDDAVRFVSIANAAWLCGNHHEETARRTLDAVVF